jgi:hypothetical protein
VRLEGLAWSGAASKAALRKMAVGELYAATGESQPTLHFREKRAAAKLGALALVGLFSLAVAFALIVALLIERLP